MAAKTTAEREGSRALGETLKSLFRSLEKRPLPDRLRAVIDQLDSSGKPSAPRRG